MNDKSDVWDLIMETFLNFGCGTSHNLGNYFQDLYGREDLQDAEMDLGEEHALVIPVSAPEVHKLMN